MKSHYSSRNPTGPTMRIGDKVVSQIDAKYLYRCAECFGELDYLNGGLVCKTNNQHQGFIHKSEATKRQVAQVANLKVLEQFYIITNGKVELKNGNQGTH